MSKKSMILLRLVIKAIGLFLLAEFNFAIFSTSLLTFLESEKKHSSYLPSLIVISIPSVSLEASITIVFDTSPSRLY